MEVRGVRELLAAAGLGAAFGAMPSCGSSQFECSADSECTLDTIDGWCEDTRFCSFPDPDCSSGREYGELAGSDLAGTCVPVAGGTEGSSGGASSGGDSTESGPADSTAEPPGSCPAEIFDDFEDGVLDAQWSAFGFLDEQQSWVGEASGAMQVTLPVGADGYAGIALNDLVEIADGHVRLEIETPPGPASTIIVAVGSLEASPGSQLLLYIYEADAALAWQPDGRLSQPLTDFFPLSVTDTPWVELDLVGSGPGATATVRVSADGTDFVELISTPHEVPLDGSVLFVYALSLDPDAQRGDVVRISTVSACPG